MVFTDKAALQAVRLRHFLRDCRKMGSNPQYLEARIKQEPHECQGFLEKTYQDIAENPKKVSAHQSPNSKRRFVFRPASQVVLCPYTQRGPLCRGL